MKTFRPTLAVAAELPKVNYPVYASPKLDGIRCSIVNGKALSRTLKPIPNKHVYRTLSNPRYDGLDGELIFGDPCSKSVYRDTNSAVMSHEGEPEVTYYVFDLHLSEAKFKQRIQEVRELLDSVARSGHCKINIIHLQQKLIFNEYSLLEYEEECLELGYEGLILRSVDSPYKFGRSTLKEGYMLKLKRFVDFESVIVGYEEEMHNGNKVEVNELGRTSRSTASEGLTGKGTLGALVVRESNTGVEFKVGTGFDAAERQTLWDKRGELIGKTIKVKSFEVGRLNLPRHPVFLGFRDAADL